MNEILEFYKQTSIYTNFGPYEEYFKSLPNDIYALAQLVNAQTIHRGTLIRSYYQKNKYSQRISLV